MRRETRKNFVALDLGQVHEFTTIAVLEQAELRGDWDAVVFAWGKEAMLRLQYLERFPMGIPYPDVVRKVAHITGSGALRGSSELLVNATMAGKPAVNLLQRAG